jgi:hypothetical protein
MITANGASFCHVDKMKAETHEIDIITEGYHAWHGATPDLIIIENRIIGYDRSVIGEAEYIHTLPIINSLDPRACTSKYLMHASVSWEFVEENMIGTNDSIFNSRANHSIIQFLLDRAIMALEIMIRSIIIENGDFMFIKNMIGVEPSNMS